MSDRSGIEWTETTWNPTTGCDRVSAGCDNCYALALAKRLKAMGSAKYQTDGDPRTSGPGFGIAVHQEALSQPYRWRNPRIVFVNSMSDLFHKEVPREFIDRVFDTMEKADWHVFQVLTKRSSLMRDYLKRRYRDVAPPGHIWLGVSVEDSKSSARIAHLRQSPAAVRFLSVEPLIGAVGPVDLSGIHWVIAGGESGPGARPMMIEWAREIRDQCAAQEVAFFFKQWGGIRPKTGGRDLDGREWNELPVPVASRAA